MTIVVKDILKYNMSYQLHSHVFMDVLNNNLVIDGVMKDMFWSCEVYNKKINFILAYGWKESIDKLIYLIVIIRIILEQARFES